MLKILKWFVIFVVIFVAILISKLVPNEFKFLIGYVTALFNALLIEILDTEK